MARARPLVRSAVQEASQPLAAFLADFRVQLKPYQLTEVTESILRAYLTVAADTPQGPDYRISEDSRKIAALQVGEACVIQAQAMQTARYKMKTAARLMENPEARFTARTMPDDKLKITRLEDGEKPRGRSGPDFMGNKSRELARMRVGDTIIGQAITAVRGPGAPGGNCKKAARRLMKQPSAQWTFKTTAQGVEIKRIR